MAKSLFIAPIGLDSGLTSICLGLVRALDHVGMRVGFYKPIAYDTTDQAAPAAAEAQLTEDRSVALIRASSALQPPTPIPLTRAQELMNKGKSGSLMEEVVASYEQVAASVDVVIVEGLIPDRTQAYTARLNVEIARNLDAEVILVAAPGQRSAAELDAWLDFSARLFADPADPDVIGVILNKVGEPATSDASQQRKAEPAPVLDFETECALFNSGRLQLLGRVDWQPALLAPRLSDVASSLTASVLHRGAIDQRRVHEIALCACGVANSVAALRPGTLVVCPGDRDDIMVTAALVALTGVPLAGLLITGGLDPDPRILAACQPALKSGLPLLQVAAHSFDTAGSLANLSAKVPPDDIERIEQVMEAIAGALDAQWLQQHLRIDRERRLSPPAFRYLLSQRARAAKKRIVLPEGNEPRTVQAAISCHQRGLAECVLLGQRDDIAAVARAQGLELPAALAVVDPAAVRGDYVDAMVALREHKGLTADVARAQLEDNVVLGTMMLAQDEVDGLVSGAIHTTANTVRPALQLIKTHAGARVVSSVFFMCLPEQVLVYGDCAINPDPDAETLADIAIQSADSAAAFGVEPRVAMISYSTGESGSGAEVDKVRTATALVRKLRPELLVDGPLQYDAAAVAGVARAKAPDSPLAGRATVFVFPDLNTGNTTYKAVQRSANVVSIGPMLQGLRKPVNDLSRGAQVEDIVYTIAVTAIQAQQLLDAGAGSSGHA